MDIFGYMEMAKRNGLAEMLKSIKEEKEKDKIATAIQLALEKNAGFLRIDVDTGDHKKLMVHCPLFDKNVHIEEVCYGCRFNPGTGRFEAKDGEYFQCNYVPGSPTDIWPATRDIQGPRPLKASPKKKSNIKKKAKSKKDELFDKMRKLENEDDENFLSSSKYNEEAEPLYCVYLVIGGLEVDYFNFYDYGYAEEAFEIGKEIIDICMREGFFEEGDGVFFYEVAFGNLIDQIDMYPDNLDLYPDPSIESNLSFKEKIEKKSQTALQEAEKLEEQIEIEKATLPDKDDLSYFDDMSREELERQLALYTELSKVLVDNTFGDDMITRTDALHIVDYIKGLLGATPEVLENSETGAVIEEVPAEEVGALQEKMHEDYDEEQIKEIAAYLWGKKIPPSIVTKEEAEKVASRLGFVKVEKIVKSAPAVLERCINHVMNENKGKKGFTKSNAIAICVNALRDKYPSVEEWVHKKKTEVEKMEKLTDKSFSQMTPEDLDKYREKLNEMEFVVRSNMNIHDDKSMAEGTKLLKKIAIERERVNKLLDAQLNPAIFDEKPLKDVFEFDDEKVSAIDHSLADEYRQVKKAQEEFDWDTYLEVAPKLLVEQNEILREWPALMAEAARQEILPKISALAPDKQEEIFVKFMERVEKERLSKINNLEDAFGSVEKEKKQERVSKKKSCRHLNPDKTFKGGFDGCVEHFMECKGLKKENAERLCSYIGRRAGKIPGKKSTNQALKKESN